jgi:acyl-CoA synthetase (AMP-forming)/AMP-acid ligase II
VSWHRVSSPAAATCRVLSTRRDTTVPLTAEGAYRDPHATGNTQVNAGPEDLTTRARSHSIGDIPRRSARRTPDKVAIIDGDVTMTFADLDTTVDRAAAALHDNGFGPADRIALLAHNCWQYAVLAFATARVPVVLVPLNFMLTAQEIAYILRHSGATGLSRSLMWQYVGSIIAGSMTADNIEIHSMPLCHCSQLDNFLATDIYLGATSFILPRPNPQSVLRTIERYRVTNYSAPPTVWISLLCCPIFDEVASGTTTTRHTTTSSRSAMPRTCTT